jgi:hypothetical protein
MHRQLSLNLFRCIEPLAAPPDLRSLSCVRSAVVGLKHPSEVEECGASGACACGPAACRCHRTAPLHLLARGSRLVFTTPPDSHHPLSRMRRDRTIESNAHILHSCMHLLYLRARTPSLRWSCETASTCVGRPMTPPRAPARRASESAHRAHTQTAQRAAADQTTSSGEPARAAEDDSAVDRGLPVRLSARAAARLQTELADWRGGRAARVASERVRADRQNGRGGDAAVNLTLGPACSRSPGRSICLACRLH